jgi:hypothetical protein
METKTYRFDSTWFWNDIDLILRNNLTCRSGSTEKPILAVTDPQVEVQIRTLLKDKYMKLCQNANTGNHTMISCTQFLRNFLIEFLYFTEITC